MKTNKKRLRRQVFLLAVLFVVCSVSVINDLSWCDTLSLTAAFFPAS